MFCSFSKKEHKCHFVTTQQNTCALRGLFCREQSVSPQTGRAVRLCLTTAPLRRAVRIATDRAGAANADLLKSKTRRITSSCPI